MLLFTFWLAWTDLSTVSNFLHSPQITRNFSLNEGLNFLANQTPSISDFIGPPHFNFPLKKTRLQTRLKRLYETTDEIFLNNNPSAGALIGCK